MNELRREIREALAGQPQAQETPPQAGNGIVITMVVEFPAHVAQASAIRKRADEFQIRVEVMTVERNRPAKLSITHNI